MALTYTFLLSRFQLSRRNGCVNDLGEVFVIFLRRELARELRIGEKHVTAAFQKLAELDLIWEKRCGRGDANQIYLASVQPADAPSYSCAVLWEKFAWTAVPQRHTTGLPPSGGGGRDAGSGGAGPRPVRAAAGEDGAAAPSPSERAAGGRLCTRAARSRSAGENKTQHRRRGAAPPPCAPMALRAHRMVVTRSVMYYGLFRPRAAGAPHRV